MGVAIVCDSTKHKLARLHYIRATAIEAAHTCRTSQPQWQKKWTHDVKDAEQVGSHNIREGYGTFEHFRNG